MKLLLFAGVLALLLLSGLWAAQRTLIYFPSRTVLSRAQAGVPDAERVAITTEDGVHLSGWFAPAAGADRHLAVLYCHGNGGNVAGRAHLLRELPALGLSVLLFDWRGYGESDDIQPTEQGLYADGRAALAWLESRTGLSPAHIVLYGESLGTGVAVELAVELAEARDEAGDEATSAAVPAPHALILQSPFTSLPDAAAVHYPWLPVSLLLRDRYDSAAKIGRVRAPVLVLHGARDGTVPVAQGRALVAAAGGPHSFIELPHAGHNDIWSHPAARCAELAAFLDGLR